MSYRSLVPQVIGIYGLDVVEVGTAQKGYRSESYRLTLATGGAANLIFFKNEHNTRQRIRSADNAADTLSSALPVRSRFDERTLRLSDASKEVYASIYNYLPGSTIPWESYTKNHIKLLGWAMSDMHSVWRASDKAVSFHVGDELNHLLTRMKRYFDSTDIQKAIQNKLSVSLVAHLGDYERLFKKLGAITVIDEHILHMDLVRGNVLFDTDGNTPWKIDNTTLTGVIDFEKAAIGHPIYDIARTLAFLLVDCANKDRASIYKYFLQ